MSKVILIRPGRTDYDAQSRLLGSLEMPMNDRGLEDVEAIIRQLQQDGVRPEMIYTCPCDPACSTARLIAESLKGTKVRQLTELRNVNQGLWQGLPKEDVRRRYPRFFRSGREKPHTICPPEGESLGEACERLEKALNKAIRRYDVFAVVVPEPMATVIRCTLQHRCPDVDDCLCGEVHRGPVEYILTDGFRSEAFLGSEHCDNGVVPALAASSENSR